MAPCSNGNIALMADVGRRNNLPWDAILGSEIAQGYKPQPKVYLATCEALNLKPEQVHDVCRTQRRPRGRPGAWSEAPAISAGRARAARGPAKPQPKGNFDVVGKNFEDFADKMGV